MNIIVVSKQKLEIIPPHQEEDIWLVEIEVDGLPSKITIPAVEDIQTYLDNRYVWLKEQAEHEQILRLREGDTVLQNWQAKEKLKADVELIKSRIGIQPV